MIIHNCEQGSEEWFAVKCGKISASHFSEVLSKKPGRVTYMRKVAAERQYGISHESYSNKAMKSGIEGEPKARAYYDGLFGPVEQVGFVELNDYVGCSPDGLVGDYGLVEIKCPHPSTHVKYVAGKKMPSDYVAQVQGQLWVTGRKWCDFVSFLPHAKKGNPFWHIKVERDEKYINVLSIAVETFIQEMEKLESKIKNNSISF